MGGSNVLKRLGQLATAVSLASLLAAPAEAQRPTEPNNPRPTPNVPIRPARPVNYMDTVQFHPPGQIPEQRRDLGYVVFGIAATYEGSQKDIAAVEEGLVEFGNRNRTHGFFEGRGVLNFGGQEDMNLLSLDFALQLSPLRPIYLFTSAAGEMRQLQGRAGVLARIGRDLYIGGGITGTSGDDSLPSHKVQYGDWLQARLHSTHQIPVAIFVDWYKQTGGHMANGQSYKEERFSGRLEVGNTIGLFGGVQADTRSGTPTTTTVNAGLFIKGRYRQ